MLVETPQILILDEATASIDSGTEQAIQHALAAVREHTTLVVIAHRLSTIVDADTILVLHRGQAVEQALTSNCCGPGTLLADVSTATCGRRAGSQRA